jgi:hypothetical protein
MCSRHQVGAAPSENLSDMAFVSKLSKEQWAEARRLRAEGASFAAIADGFGVTRDAVARHAKLHGWGTPLADAGKQPPAPTKAARVHDEFKQVRRNLSHRIIKILDLDLKIMELRMLKRLGAAETGEAPEGMSDEELKRLGAFKKTIQEHTEFSPDTEPTAGGAGRAKSADQTATSEADVFRREIAERLEKLLPPS